MAIARALYPGKNSVEVHALERLILGVGALFFGVYCFYNRGYPAQLQYVYGASPKVSIVRLQPDLGLLFWKES